MIDLTQAKQTFQESLVREAGVQGFGLTADEINKKQPFILMTKILRFKQDMWLSQLSHHVQIPQTLTS